MKNKKKILIIALPLLAIVTGYFIYEHMIWAKTDNAQLQAHTLMLTPKVSGYVQEVLITEGQFVKEGDILVVIDPRDYENALSIAQGEYDSSEASFKEAEKNHERLSSLYKKGAISSQQFDNAQKTFQEAKAHSDSLRAKLAQNQLNLQNTKIIAPRDGYIAKKGVEVGQLANAGVPLIGFVEAKERWIIANFKETEIADISVGNKVLIDVDAIPGKEFNGEVESLSSATGATFTLLPPDNATGNFTKVVQHVPVKIKLNNLTEREIKELRAGLSVIVKVKRN